MCSFKGSSASQIGGAGKAVVGAGKAGNGAGEAVVGVGEAEAGTLWTLISGVSEAVDKDITAALQEAVDKHEPLKASVCELPLVVCVPNGCLAPHFICGSIAVCAGIQRGGLGICCEARHQGGSQRFARAICCISSSMTNS